MSNEVEKKVARKVEEKVEEKDELLIDGLDDFVGDPEREEAGTWRPLNDGTGREFLIAFGENPRFQSKLMRLMKPQMPILKRNEDASFRLRDSIAGKALAGTVLLNWRGGKLPAFNEKLVEKILVDRRYRKLRSQVEEFGNDEAALMEDAEEDAEKN